MDRPVFSGDGWRSEQEYVIFDDGRRLPDGGPLQNEYYGAAWVIHRPPSGPLEPVVLVPDPGDGSAEPLARKILALLNCGGGEPGRCVNGQAYS
jgi:hypothetical protein